MFQQLNYLVQDKDQSYDQALDTTNEEPVCIMSSRFNVLLVAPVIMNLNFEHQEDKLVGNVAAGAAAIL